MKHSGRSGKKTGASGPYKRRAPSYKRHRKSQPLSKLAKGLIDPLMRKQGFARQEIVTKWESVVGDTIARHSQPERISFPRNARKGGTLFVRVEGAFALELQHHSVEILDRLNTYFGYAAVEKMVIRQGPLIRQARQKTAEPPQASKEDVAAVSDRVEGTRHDRLKQALQQVGEQVAARNHPRKG